MLIKTFTPKLITPEYPEGPPTLVSRVRGEVRAVLRDLNLRPVLDTGWTPNLITNQWLERLSTANIAGYMHIGTSSTAPSFTDTSLGAWVARTAGSGRYNPVNPTGPDYAFSVQKRGRFDPGVATGWVREMGLSHSNVDNPSTINIRALLSPAIDKGVDNYLDVYHRLWHYPPLTPSAVTPLVLAFDGKTYNCQIGAHDVDNTYYAQDSYDANMLYSSQSVGTYGANGTSNIGYPDLLTGNWTNYSGTDNTWPYGYGTVDSGGTAPNPWAEGEAYLGLDVGNFTYGIGGIALGYQPHTCQAWMTFMESTTPGYGIPKDETRRFRFRARTVVTRYTP